MTAAARKQPDLRVVDDAIVKVHTDLGELTCSMVETIEDTMQMGIEAFCELLSDASQRKGKLLRVLAYAIRREDNPGLTVEAAGRYRVHFINDTIPPTSENGSAS